MNRRAILKALLVAPFAALFRRREPRSDLWIDGTHANDLFRRPERNYVENPNAVPWTNEGEGKWPPQIGDYVQMYKIGFLNDGPVLQTELVTAVEMDLRTGEWKWETTVPFRRPAGRLVGFRVVRPRPFAV